MQSALSFPGLVVDSVQSRVYVDRAAAEPGLDQLALAYLQDTREHGALPSDSAAGLDELLRQPDSARGARALKGQLIGPVSLATYLTDERQRPLIYDEMFSAALSQHLRLRVAWLEARLRTYGSATIVCLDEPFLESVGMPFMPIDWQTARERIDEVFASVAGCKALFAGGTVNWNEVLQTSVDLVIADAYEHGDMLVSAADAIQALLERQGGVGLGMVPADAEALQHVEAAGLFARLAELLLRLEEAGLPPERLLRRAAITPTDTLGRLPVDSAERALQLCAELSLMLRSHYQLG